MAGLEDPLRSARRPPRLDPARAALRRRVVMARDPGVTAILPGPVARDPNLARGCNGPRLGAGGGRGDVDADLGEGGRREGKEERECDRSHGLIFYTERQK